MADKDPWAGTLLYRHPRTGERYIWNPLHEHIEIYKKGAHRPYRWVRVNWQKPEPGPLVWNVLCDVLCDEPVAGGRYGSGHSPAR